MDSKIMETLENLEDKIESLKWLVTAHFRIKKAKNGEMNIIQKSFGILGKRFPKGVAYENRMRREWEANFRERIS